MRTMLLSFKPEWYNRIKEGSKIFEYRRTFPDEEILAYMYVSSPMKMIVGKIHLGRKIDINTWKEEYKEDEQVCERIDDFLTRHTYAMPILSFQMTKEIDLETLRKFNRNLPIDFPPILIFSRNFRCQMPNPYVLPLFLPLPAETRANSLLPDYHIQQLR